MGRQTQYDNQENKQSSRNTSIIEQIINNSEGYHNHIQISSSPNHHTGRQCDIEDKHILKKLRERAQHLSIGSIGEVSEQK